MPYGTVGRVKVRPENREKLIESLNSQPDVEGFQKGWVMFPENRDDEAILVVFFDDKDSYWKNANDPAQDERYRDFSQYFDSEPEWSDGEWVESR